MLRAPSLALLVLALPPTLSLGRSALLESEARALGGRLGAALTSLVAPDVAGADGVATSVPDVVSSADDVASADIGVAAGDGAPAIAGSTGGARGGRSRKSTPQHGVFVDAPTVLRLAARGVVPTGTPVPPASGRPAGIELSNVSALGVGVHDGDVLTEVAGSPVRSEGQVVGAVLGFRARHASSISATFYRGREKWHLVVEMPYPPGS